ncbi:MAG: carboxylesterase family protein [Ilumatobacteraceae bacterium]
MESSTITVTTSFGAVRGLQRDDIAVFKGIRYASAERFGLPSPITSWEGEFDATSYGPQAPQLVGMMERALGGSSLPSSEDCLTLNVFTPSVEGGPARPVLVWIHGGAFTTGTGAMPWYDGSQLVRRGDVVVVTINYRLGALGFSGRTNCGLADQVCALQWVQQMIGSFGGDPHDVTIFGESAGGSSVVALMAAPTAAPLFHRAFAMSPSIGQLRSGERADEALAELLAEAGVTTLAELADLPTEQVLAAQDAMLKRNPGAGLTDFSPCEGSDLIPAPLLAAAAANPVPLVIGTTRDEMLLFTTFDPALADLDEARLEALVAARLGERTQVALERYRTVRPDASLVGLFGAVQTDVAFRVPARRLADERVNAGNPTWMYWFTWASPAFHGRLGSCHAMDIPFAFHNLDRKGVPQFTGDGDDRIPVADAYSGAVLGLARSGAAPWPAYDTTTRSTMVFDVSSGVVDDPEPEIRELW